MKPSILVLSKQTIHHFEPDDMENTAMIARGEKAKIPTIEA
jgi:hypothetical protein